MGVTSCGKSAVAEALAGAIGGRYIEGDALHGDDNIAKMARGEPLTDDDRWPWLRRVADALKATGPVSVASCSALCRRYRDCLREGGNPIQFIHLHAEADVIASRMQARSGHFMPPALLDSQLALLEPLDSDELGTVIDVSSPLAEVVSAAVAFASPLLQRIDTGHNT